MEILVILLFIILLIVILSFRSRAIQRIDMLQKEIMRLREEIKQAAPPVQAPTETAPFAPPPKAASAPPPPPRPAPAPPPRPVSMPGKEVTEPHVFAPIHAQAAPPPRSFFEKHPDLEKFIGENLLSKVGIAVLVLGIGFIVKYAIDNDKIGPAGRVGIGLLCGGILVGIAHYLRNSYKAFSSVLVGGGLAAFYFSIALAYHQYQLFSQTVSFIIMLVITAFAVILSLLYDRQELAVIALVGGFVTPFLVSNGSGNYKVLFSYLLILNTGLLVLSYRKSWRLLNTLAFGFTAILFATWLATLPAAQSTIATYQGAFVFATTFYILFFLINIAHNIRENKRFVAFDFGILLVNTCLYFAAGLYLFSAMGLARYQGLFSACMAVFNLASSYFLFRKKKVDTNILYLLIGITMTFISLTAPIQLHGHFITLFWASEAVLLYWLARKSGLTIIGIASLLVWVAMLVSLGMDWVQVYVIRLEKGSLPVIFNKGLMTTLYAAACCYMIFLLRRKPGPAAAATGPSAANVSGIDRITNQAMIIVASCLLFAGGALEITYQFDHFYPGTRLSTLYLVLYGYIWAYGIVLAGNKWRWFTGTGYASALIILSIILYLAMIQPTYEIQEGLLQYGNQGHFLAHWASALLVVLIIRQCISWWRKDKLQPLIPPQSFSWLICIVIVIFLSAEIELLVNHIFYDKSHSIELIDRIYLKTGLPILWGLSSFMFMWLGMRNKFKPLRIISLALFSITLLKLFLIDIRNIPVAGKIAAFFCLGILLLVVSFMYQRLKKIIIEDEEKRSA